MAGFSTIATHSGYTPNEDDGAIIPPIHLTTTFKFGNKNKHEYSRSGNPTRKVLEQTLAALEGGKYALAYSSGSAALANIGALLEKGQGILFSSDAYGGTYRFITKILAQQGLPHYVADLTDIAAAKKLLAEHDIKIVWVETPTNPLLKVTDIRKLADAAHEAGAILVVDNTFATPILQQPLAHGADIVAHSTTKYINGHSDSVGGALIINDDDLYKQLAFLQNAIGAILSPFDSWLTLRGLRTLELRVERHVANARKIAAFLQKHPKIKKVYYPEFFTGEQGKIVKKQMKGPGGMISVELNETYDVQKFLKALKYFPLAESLGGVESLIDHPASMTHASIPKEEREKIGLTDGLFRLSVGIENAEDLLADLEQALDKA
ncbi:PLP-dependent transferase [Candidatus Saccharibacteria bacterium]|nr:PLP-dependent transferase [Candidatus Saccharibacteria bacterium]